MTTTTDQPSTKCLDWDSGCCRCNETESICSNCNTPGEHCNACPAQVEVLPYNFSVLGDDANITKAVEDIVGVKGESNEESNDLPEIVQEKLENLSNYMYYHIIGCQKKGIFNEVYSPAVINHLSVIHRSLTAIRYAPYTKIPDSSPYNLHRRRILDRESD